MTSEWWPGDRSSLSAGKIQRRCCRYLIEWAAGLSAVCSYTRAYRSGKVRKIFILRRSDGIASTISGCNLEKIVLRSIFGIVVPTMFSTLIFSHAFLLFFQTLYPTSFKLAHCGIALILAVYFVACFLLLFFCEESNIWYSNNYLNTINAVMRKWHTVQWRFHSHMNAY